MEIYTLNVGQGQFVVVTGENQAIIVDSFLPLNPSEEIINVKGALAKILTGKELIGLMITGFDADHFNEIGLKIILNKYRPNWIMYPKYFKKSTNADNCFSVINSFDANEGIARISVSLSKNENRFYTKLSNDFTFEAFSPHQADMNSSNNCSLVVKIVENASKASYLVTGDTENERWENIAKYFGSSIKADVLDAPHHGSKNGITDSAMSLTSSGIT
jgi:beta-lactamase superfamily II metal-dependent hydrolase